MNKRSALLVLVIVCIYVLMPVGLAEASSSTPTTANAPWEKAIDLIATSLSGPVAFGLALLMIVCGFCGIAFVGAEIGGWIRWVAVAAVACGTLGCAPTVLSLFGFTTTMIL